MVSRETHEQPQAAALRRLLRWGPWVRDGPASGRCPRWPGRRGWGSPVACHRHGSNAPESAACAAWTAMAAIPLGQRGNVLLRDGLDLAAGAAWMPPRPSRGWRISSMEKAQIAPATDEEAQPHYIGWCTGDSRCRYSARVAAGPVTRSDAPCAARKPARRATSPMTTGQF